MPKVPKEKLFLYPHMMPGDIEIWEKFLQQYPNEFGGFRYDLHVGTGYVLDQGAPDWAKKHARAVTRKRIDVVATKDFQTWLIEVKPDAGLAAYGQLRSYQLLYERDTNRGTLPRAAIVTDFVDPDTQWVMERDGIKIYLVNMSTGE